MSDTVQTWAGLRTKDPDAIRIILDQEEPWTNVSDLRQHLAQDVMNLLQSELDGASAEDTEYRTVCAKCLHALSLAYAVLPSTLFLPRTARSQHENEHFHSSGKKYIHQLARFQGFPRSVCLTWFYPLDRERDHKSFMQAALTWRQLRHDNILPLYAVSREIFLGPLCFISPWMGWSNALDYLRENPKHDRRGWVLDIASALQYLHNLDPCVIHGAVAAENILIRKDLRCTLSGFWERRSGPSQLKDAIVMTDEQAKLEDIYAFGLTIIEMYTGERNVVDSPAEVPVNLWDKVVRPCVGPASERPAADAILKTMFRHHRTHLRAYQGGNTLIEDRVIPAEDFMMIVSRSDWDGISMQLAEAAYMIPKLDDRTSKLLRERLKQLEPWKDVGIWARDHEQDVQSVMDELQRELDQVTAEDSAHRRKCVKCLRELSQQHDILPSQLYIPEASFDPFKNDRLDGGGFSDIYNGIIMGQLVCVKSLRVHQTGQYSPEHMKKVLCHEALIWRQATHKNILPFYGVSVDIIPSGLCFISPWMAHGNIRKYLDAHPTYKPLRWVWDVANAMQYLHNLDPCIIHKDIRGANILVGNDLRAYLSDFGISLVVETRLPGTRTRGAGNVRWLPPELINVSEGSRNVMKEWDIYSFGCTVLEMYTRQKPYSELSDAAVAYHVSQKKLPQQPPPSILPPSLWESVVVPCLSSEPSKRPSADTILGILEWLDYDPFSLNNLPLKMRGAMLLTRLRKSDSGIIPRDQLRPTGTSSKNADGWVLFFEVVAIINWLKKAVEENSVQSVITKELVREIDELASNVPARVHIHGCLLEQDYIKRWATSLHFEAVVIMDICRPQFRAELSTEDYKNTDGSAPPVSDDAKTADAHQQDFPAILPEDDGLSMLLEVIKKALETFLVDATARDWAQIIAESDYDKIPNIMKQPTPWRGVEGVPYESAQKVLDHLQSVRDQLPLTHLEHRKKYMKCLYALSKKYNILPSQLYYRKSEIVDREPFHPGGTFSDISRATIVIGNRLQSVCLKRVRIRGSKKEFNDALKAFTQEAFLWSQLRHENILPFIGVSEEVMDYRSFCLISPWMADGNVRDFLVNNPDHDRLRMIWDIASGIQYLHGLDPHIIHKDIRGPNILVGPKPHHRCYLVDFGISLVAGTKVTHVDRVAGHGRWMAPELWKPDYDNGLLCCADIYSFGCTVIEIYTGQPPYPDVRDEVVIYQLLGKILPKQPEPHVLPANLWNQIVLPCLSHSPQERPSATDILKTLKELNEPSLVEYLAMIKTGVAAEEECIPAARSALSTALDISESVDLVEEE